MGNALYSSLTDGVTVFLGTLALLSQYLSSSSPRYTERFSFVCRRVIGFHLTQLRNCLKKLPPILHPIRSINQNQSRLVRARFPALYVEHGFDWFAVLSVSFVIG